MVASIRYLAGQWRWEPTRVHRFLKKLKGCNAIATATATAGATGHTLISICNYEKYQSDDRDSATAIATPPDSEPQQERKKEKKERNIRPISPPNGGSENDATVDFESFWQIYPSRQPHRNPKQKARQKFKAALKKGIAADVIICGARNFAGHVRREGTKPQFVPMAQTWLNQESWDEYQEAPAEPEQGAGWL